MLLCRHDLTLDNSTDIAEHPEFAGRRYHSAPSPDAVKPGRPALLLGRDANLEVVSRSINMSTLSTYAQGSVISQLPLMCGRWSTVLPDGREESGFFVLNFTLVELRTLYAKQAIPGRDQSSRHKYRWRLSSEGVHITYCKKLCVNALACC